MSTTNGKKSSINAVWLPADEGLATGHRLHHVIPPQSEICAVVSPAAERDDSSVTMLVGQVA